MNRITTLAAASLFAALLAHPAMAAADAGAKTCEQVQAELADAQRWGTLASIDHSGLTLRDLQPQRYPAMERPAGKTRDEVQAELAQAVRTGDLRANDESGRQLWEQQPHRYPPMTAGQGKTVAQVQAELAEALRTGDLLADDVSGRKLNEVFPSRYTGARTERQVMAASR